MERVPSEAPTQGLSASGLPRTEQEPRAAHPAPHHVRKEQGKQRNVPQPRGLIHPPVPGGGAAGSPTTTPPFVRCDPPGRTPASHPLPGPALPRHLERSLQ